MDLHAADPDYYFRVDAHRGLRAMVEDDVFRPARWDDAVSPHPHRALLAEAQRKSPDEAIYRMSFWINEHHARRHFASLHAWVPHTLLRVARRHVAHALDGWNFDVDDCLPGQADLIWHRGAACGGHFFDRGVPLDRFEVWEGLEWQPWPSAQALEPDSVRMARICWQPIALVTRQGGPAVAYWHVVPHRPAGADASLWILLTLDGRSRGTLGGEDRAVWQAIDLLLAGPLRHVAGSIGGLLTIHAAEDRLWTEQYAFRPLSHPTSSWWVRLWPGRRSRPSGLPFEVEPQTALGPRQELALIRASGLRQARPEVRAHAWGPDQ